MEAKTVTKAKTVSISIVGTDWKVEHGQTLLWRRRWRCGEAPSESGKVKQVQYLDETIQLQRIKWKSWVMFSSLLRSRHSSGIPFLHHNSIISFPISYFNEIPIYAFQPRWSCLSFRRISVSSKVNQMYFLNPGRRLVCSLELSRQCQPLWGRPCK